MLLLIALALSFTTSAIACGDDHTHTHARRYTTPPALLPKPSRPLEWGDLNIIHMTDTHGWLLGHQKASFPEPNYSGTFGDFASFVEHMKKIAKRKNVDLLLVDSGDLHDGTGLTDGFPPGGVNAHDSNQFVKKLPYDIMAIGNHELYVYNNTLDMYTNFVPALNGRYLSSNVNITVNGSSVPVGSRYRKFTTALGRKVTSFGILFDFTGNDQNTTVQHVEDLVKESWFAQAIEDEPDLFLLVGHMPIAKDNWPTVFNAIRAVHPHTPIMILGGHTHIRDCNQLDGRSISLESGRYMETVGWLTAKLDNKGSTENITFTRRYLDPNRVTYEYHTGTSNHTFDTPSGVSITKGLKSLATKFNLGSVFGVAPHDFTITQAPYPSENSSLSLFAEKAAPFALALNNSRAGIPNIIIANSGTERFDVYAGTFTRDDQFTVVPFADSFFFIEDLPLSVGEQVVGVLNDAGANNRRRGLEDVIVDKRYKEWLSEMDRRNEEAKNATLTLGYVTTDSCASLGPGDDVTHTPLAFHAVPDFIASLTPANLSSTDTIDLVFIDFIEAQLISTVNSLLSEAGISKVYSSSDVKLYSNVLANQVLGLYAQAEWN